MDDSLIFQENSQILYLLPSLATGLLTKQNYVDTIYASIDRYVKGNKNEKNSLLKIREQIQALEENMHKDVVIIDEEKTVLLAYAFPLIYTPALAIATGKGIEVEVFSEETIGSSELEKIARDHLTAKDGKVPVFVRVALKPHGKVDSVPSEPNIYLKLRQMLEQVGHELTLDTQEVRASLIPWVQKESEKDDHQEKCTVDLYNWHCSCDEFFKSFESQPRETGQLIVRAFQSEVDSGSRGDDTLLRYFLARQTSLHNSTLPICVHLLAVILAVFNLDNVEIQATQISDVNQI